MKREILFRGKDKATDQWVYGDYTHNEGLNTHYISRNVNNISRKVWEVDPDTVEQYMGKKDKNGKKIFEGDVVHLKGDGYAGAKIGKDYYRVVTFHEGSFCLSIEDGVHYPLHTPIYEHSDSHNIVNWDVIGNVTDNPELIK